MAYQTGTVDNYRQLLKMFATFVTTNATLVGLSQEWVLNTGRVSSQAIEYLEHSSFTENGLMQWDKSIAMGWDDTFASYQVIEGYYGWSTYTTDLPDAYLGFESAVAVLPDHYIITAVHWDNATSEADQQPETWFLEYSDDNSIWTEGDDVSTAGGGTYGDQTTWASQEARSFDIPTGLGTHVYWRLRFITNNGDTTTISLGRLRFYNSTPDWISYSYSNEYQFQAPGLTTTEEIYTGLRMVEDPIFDYFNWEIMGTIGFDGIEPFKTQPFSNGATIYLRLYDQPLKYWLVANGQRAMMVVKVSTVYVMLYLGKFLPYATPAQHPYPLIVSGNGASYNKRWSEESSENANLGKNYSGTDYYMTSGSWHLISSMSSAGGTNSISSSSIGLLPTTYGCIGDGYNQPYNNLLPNPDGSYCIFPFIIMSGLSAGDKGMLGEIEGLFWVTGNSNLSENILTINSQDYLVFQNVYRTGQDDYCAMELK